MNEQNNPWQVKGEKRIYDNPWIDVTEYDVINPSGGKGIYGKVHFKGLAIGILPLDEHLHTYLVGQYRFPLNEYSWEIPEGGAPIGTDPLGGAKRELLEETGLKAEHWQPLLRMHLSNSVSDELALVYLATGLSQHMPEPEETEQLVVKRLPLEDAWKMVEDGTITDAISVAAITKIKLRLLEGDRN